MPLPQVGQSIQLRKCKLLLCLCANLLGCLSLGLGCKPSDLTRKVQPALEKCEPSAGVDKVETFGLPSLPANRCHCQSNQSSHTQGWCPSAKNLSYLSFNLQLDCVRFVTTKVKHKSCKKTEKSSTLAQLQGRAKGAWNLLGHPHYQSRSLF
jgi:hypothetical protein